MVMTHCTIRLRMSASEEKLCIRILLSPTSEFSQNSSEKDRQLERTKELLVSSQLSFVYICITVISLRCSIRVRCAFKGTFKCSLVETSQQNKKKGQLCPSW